MLSEAGVGVARKAFLDSVKSCVPPRIRTAFFLLFVLRPCSASSRHLSFLLFVPLSSLWGVSSEEEEEEGEKPKSKPQSTKKSPLKHSTAKDGNEDSESNSESDSDYDSNAYVYYDGEKCALV
mmetsp:Transcript_3380/g.8038  ORF Transcript_3380/g.8038 Transcript_3380/m.8038 type:complete len:123 (+) Transcript_3380:103-471(+)